VQERSTQAKEFSISIFSKITTLYHVVMETLFPLKMFFLTHTVTRASYFVEKRKKKPEKKLLMEDIE
jgi:hypothetical protein